MKKAAVLLSGLCLALVPLVPLAAKADTLYLPPPPNGASAYTSPYGMTLTAGSSTSTIDAWCMTATNEVWSGESWSVTQVNGLNLSSNNLTSANATQYEQEAYILSQYTSSNGQVVQDALWKIFDTGYQDADSTYDSDANALVAAAQNMSLSFYTDGALAEYTFYTYDGGTITGNQSPYTLPQDFITGPGATPEPSSLLLMGSGLTGLAGLVRRKLIRA